MAMTEKERCAREILAYADQVRNLTINYTASKMAMNRRGFIEGADSAIVDEDLINLNIKATDFHKVVSALDVLGAVINGLPIESSEEVSSSIFSAKWWSK